jgi:RNase P/RNase MRP subunit p30
MQYFDIVDMEDVPVEKLGYKKIFNNKNITLYNANQEKKGLPYIIEADSSELNKYIKRDNIIGIIIRDLFLDRNLIELAKQNEKFIIFKSTKLTNSSSWELIRNINKMRFVLKYCMHVDAMTAIATMAKNNDELLSAIQQLEIAKLIGADEEYAKYMLHSLEVLER